MPMSGHITISFRLIRHYSCIIPGEVRKKTEQTVNCLILKGYSTPYFDFCSNCSICTIKTYERLKEREKKFLTAENCARKAKFRLIPEPEVKLTTFEARDQ